MRELLEAEGVRFDGDRVVLEEYRWIPVIEQMELKTERT